jgi:carboxymethylenebutenolidase
MFGAPKEVGMHTEKLQVQVPGEKQPMSVYLAKPDGAGPFPVVIVFEEIFGVNDHIKNVTERVAREGYIAVAPDIHYRHAANEVYNYDQEGMQKGMQLIGKLKQSEVLADVNATLAVLRARKDVHGDKVGCMGFCIGGHLAFLTASTGEIKATASFYGGGIAAMGLGVAEPTVTRAGSIKGKIICFFGGQDSMIPPSQVETIKKALDDHGVKNEIVVYQDAGHAFFRDVDPKASRPEAAKDAWDKTKRLFAEELR